MVSIKDVVWSSVKVPRVQQTPEEGRRTYQLKRCENNNKDEDNSPKNLNDKNQQASSQKFRQRSSRSFIILRDFTVTWTSTNRHLVFLFISQPEEGKSFFVFYVLATSVNESICYIHLQKSSLTIRCNIILRTTLLGRGGGSYAGDTVSIF